MEWLLDVEPTSTIDVKNGAQEARLKALREVILANQGETKENLMDAGETRFNTYMNTVIFDIHKSYNQEGK